MDLKYYKCYNDKYFIRIIKQPSLYLNMQFKSDQIKYILDIKEKRLVMWWNLKNPQKR